MGLLNILKYYFLEHKTLILKCLKWFSIILILVVTSFLIYNYFHKEPESKPSSVINLDGTINKDKKYEEVVKVKHNIEEKTTFEYIEKETKEDADVEFNNTEKKVYVKVNGQKHEIENNVKEVQKFENGKLVVTQKQESVISIAAPKPAKASISYYLGSGNSHGIGFNYNVSKNLTINALHIDNKSYIGITVPIGNMNSTTKTQDVDKKEGK